MAIPRARYTLAAIALLGLVGCQSSGNNSTASKANPFSNSNVAASGTKTAYPAKPSTQTNPNGTNPSTAGGLATQPGGMAPASPYPGAQTNT